MEEYIVSARKYRPMTFDSVVGQKALTTTLKNAVKSGKLAHAYLFCGPRGVGKTTCARIFAKTINCMSPTEEGEACNNCESCQAFNEQRSYNIFELDAASNNSVENIKSLMDQTRIPPQVGKYKVFIIDEVHMLSTSAFNAFLKTLEEPPAHVIFILATTEKHKILPTIISRCQIYDFERMTVQNTIDHLKLVAEKEGIAYEEQALAVIAEKADGGMRDALSIFDQAASFSQGNITYEKVIEDLNVLDADNYFNFVDLALENKVSDMMVLLNQLIGKGFDGGNLVLGLASHVRNVLMAKNPETLSLLEVSDQQRQRYQEQAKKCPTPFLYNALKVMNQCDINYRQSSNKRLLVELTLIQVGQLTQPDDDASVAGRSPKRLKSLFRKLLSQVQPKPAEQVAGAVHSLVREKRETAKAVVEKTIQTTPDKPAAKATATAAKPGMRLKIGQASTFANLRKSETQTYSKQEEEVEETTTQSVNTFTQEDLEREWISMCNRMPQGLSGLAQRMKNMEVAIKEYPEVEVIISNQQLLTQMNNIKGRIRATLCDRLNNGGINLLLRLAKTEEIKPLLTKKELFEKLRKENTAVEKLCKVLDLQMV